eukprot:1020412-Rhodomonas_salina.1
MPARAPVFALGPGRGLSAVGSGSATSNSNMSSVAPNLTQRARGWQYNVKCRPGYKINITDNGNVDPLLRGCQRRASS